MNLVLPQTKDIGGDAFLALADALLRNVVYKICRSYVDIRETIWRVILFVEIYNKTKSLNFLMQKPQTKLSCLAATALERSCFHTRDSFAENFR